MRSLTWETTSTEAVLRGLDLQLAALVTGWLAGLRSTDSRAPSKAFDDDAKREIADALEATAEYIEAHEPAEPVRVVSLASLRGRRAALLAPMGPGR